MLSILRGNMGSICSKPKQDTEVDDEERRVTSDIDRRISQEAREEKHIQKLLLLGTGESGKSTIFKQIRLLYQSGFDEVERRSYTSVIHANVYQSIKVCSTGKDII